MTRAISRRLVLAVALIVAALAPLHAADIDGKWSGSIDTPMGAIPIEFNFKADGATLNGSMAGPDGGQIPIKNGKVDGTKITFSLDLDFGQGPVTINYTGVVSPGMLKMQSEFMGMTNDFTLKKAT